ncbi:inositol-trisphosphate 3-kinase homolog [Symsagittifera roscoffensis]|uniref:inositol-trisphosphate 3-kinase homolog n=1 Tax=Symsagittifera roscoffensis TaxID=84072 RepID=UPI00307BF1F8
MICLLSLKGFMVSLMGNKPKIDEPSPWIQIAGHMDCFVPFENNRKVAKAIKEDRSEYNNYVLIDENDALFAFLPPFHGLLEEKIKLQIDSAIHKHDEWLVLSNVLTGYIEPVVMDVKMGKETCGAKQYHVKMTKRRDLFEKFCDLEFPLELLSEDEIRDQAVSKFRYAELRDKISTTSQYGFRIEASNLDGFKKKDYVKANSLQQSQDICRKFSNHISESQLKQIVARLKTFRNCVLKSKFCQTHQLIGSSLLIAFDRHVDHSDVCGVWLIDLFQATQVSLNQESNGENCTSSSFIASRNCNIAIIEGASNLSHLFENILNAT